MAIAQHPHAEDTTDCRSCGVEFDLARQHYFDELCPSCKEEQDGADAVNPVVGKCFACNTDVRADDEHYSQKAAPHDVHGPVMVCPDHQDFTWHPPRGI